MLQLNHFQAVLATDGTTTYVLFIYGDMGTTIGNNVQVRQIKHGWHVLRSYQGKHEQYRYSKGLSTCIYAFLTHGTKISLYMVSEIFLSRPSISVLALKLSQNANHCLI